MAGCERVSPESTVPQGIQAGGTPDAPTVSISTPVYTDETVFRDAVVGEGLAITSREQDVEFTITLANGATGQTIVSSGSEPAPLSGWAENYEGFALLMDCATEGSQIVGAIPASDFSPEAAAQLGLTEGQAVAAVVDVNRVYLAAANGAPQFNDRQNMPSVVLAPSGQPGVVIPDSAPPSELVVEVLKKGDGAEVTASESAQLKYTGLTWAEKNVFDSSWGQPSVAMTLDSVVPGFAQALEGQTVGSQILAVIPPELGYGDQATGGIPAGSTLVFVIDIVGTDPLPATPAPAP